MSDIRINESTFPLKNGGTGKLAVFIYAGDGDPIAHLKCAIDKYVGDYKDYTELIDSQLNCPWVRVIISDINEMEQCSFEEFIRDMRLDKILSNNN